jgi:hypothetical protein
MTLFTLDIPAYTASPSEIVVKTIENKRYTMRDIGKLEQRIKNVEYYSALSLAETKATDSAIFYEDNATQKEKYGIVVDNFTGFDVGDTNNSDFLCAIEGGSLKPYVKTTNVKLVPTNKRTVITEDVNGAKKQIWNIPVVTNSEKILNAQLAATKNTSIQPPVLVGKFEGELRIFPSTDTYFSVDIPPVVISEAPSPILPPRSSFSPPSLPAARDNAPAPPPVVPPPPPPVLTPRTLPLPPASPPNPPPAFVAPTAPPAFIPPPPPNPVLINVGIDSGVQQPEPLREDVEILVLSPPPIPPGPPPPTPPAVVIQGSPVAVVDVVATSVESKPTDVIGTAPKIAVIQTWYSPPRSGGGGLETN